MKAKLLVILLLVGFPALVIYCLVSISNNRDESSYRVTVKNDLNYLVAAVKNFHEDYGRFPETSENGIIETAADNAELIRILSGGFSKENTRGIRYLEVPRRQEGRKYGVDPKTGVWHDPRGNFYRIRIKSYLAPSKPISNPYSLDEPNGFNEPCIAWSLGMDGIQGQRKNPHTRKLSDDIVSWEK